MSWLVGRPAGRPLAGLTLAVSMLTVLAAESPEPEPDSPSRGRWDWLTSGDRWDARQQFLSDGIVGAVERIDRIFGDDRLDDDTRRSRLHLKAGAGYSREDELFFLSSFRLRLVLPRLQNRLQFIVDDDLEVEETESAEEIADAARESKLDAAFRFLFSEDARHRLSFDAGVRGIDPVQGFGRMRGRVIVPFEHWELRLTERIAWLTADGFEQTTEMRWTRPLPQRWWFRSTTQLQWEQEQSGVMPRQYFQVGRALSFNRAYRFGMAGAWPEVPHTREAVYSADFTFRQQLRKRWLFLEVVPAVDFRQERNYRANPGISVRLELILGDTG